jgi:hypothetical protein
MRSVYHIIGVLLMLCSPLAAQRYYHVLPGSKLWFDGSSSVNTFTCTAYHVKGSASEEGDSMSADIVIDVRSLDCGNAMMNEDMFTAMKVHEFPVIRYSLTGIGGSREDSTGHGVEVMTIGRLTIAGVTAEVWIPVIIRPTGNGTYLVTGAKELSMRDFRIDPPTAFFGLIRAHEQLTVGFSIRVAPGPLRDFEIVTNAAK